MGLASKTHCGSLQKALGAPGKNFPQAHSKVQAPTSVRSCCRSTSRRESAAVIEKCVTLAKCRCHAFPLRSALQPNALLGPVGTKQPAALPCMLKGKQHHGTHQPERLAQRSRGNSLGLPSYRKHAAYVHTFGSRGKAVNSYWDSGSRAEYALVHLATRQCHSLPTATHPYFDIAHAGLLNSENQDLAVDHIGNVILKRLPAVFALVEAGVSCGKAATASVYYSAEALVPQVQTVGSAIVAEINEEFRCQSCGRPEAECSANPCAAVIADRAEA